MRVNLKLAESAKDSLTLSFFVKVFKILAIWKIVFQALTAPVSAYVNEALETIKTSFFWNKKNHEDGYLKNVYIRIN